MLIQAGLVIFSGALGLFCLFGIAQPVQFLGVVERIFLGSGGIQTVVVLRAIFGAALIYSAGTSRFPLFVYLIGGLMLISAAVLPFIGQERIDRLIERFRELPTNTLRIWLMGGFGFATFLIVALWR
jgi:hypothetical protein